MTMPEVGSKRSNGYDEYAETESHKKPRTGRMELRLLLVGRYCGAIIGKGGENVKRLREKHRVQISGLNNRSEDRVLTVNGERENCINALKEILPVSSCEAPYSSTNPRDKCSYEINFLVHSGHVGSVIGKGGAKIKEITDASNGKIKIYQDCLPGSNERIVAIGGDTVEKIIAAMEIVLDTVENLPKKSPLIHYDPINKGDGGAVNNMGDGGHMGLRGNQMGRASGNQMSGANQLAIGGGRSSSFGALGGLNLTGAAGLLGQFDVGAQGGGGGILGAGMPSIGADGILGSGRPGGLLSGGQQGGFGGQSGGFGMNRAQLGNTLANQLGNPLASQLGNQLGNQLSNQLSNQLGNQLGNQFGNQLGSQLQNQLGSQLQQQLGSQLQQQLGSQLHNQLGSQLHNQMGSNMAVAGVRQSNKSNKRGDNYQNNGNDAEPLDFMTAQTITKILVSREVCSTVIGKSGKNITEIRQASGARIDFAGHEKAYKEDRLITIAGTQQQVQIAEQLMTQFVRNRNN